MSPARSCWPASSTSRVSVRRHVLDRRHPAQHLLDRARQQRRVGDERWRARSGCAQQLLDAAADHVARRLVAADEEQQRLEDDLVVVEAVAVDLGVHEHADEVVGRARAARRDHAPGRTRRTRMNAGRRGLHPLRTRRRASRAGRRTSAAARPRSVGRHAEHVADHDHRERRREVVHEVARAASRTPRR